MVLLSKFLHVLGNLLDSYVETLVVIVDISLHFNKVNNSLEVCFSTYGELDRNCVTLQALLHHVDNIIEISSHNVHLIDIDHSRNLVLVRLSPDSFGLRLNAALCAKNGNRTVQNTQRTLNLNGEVHVTGSVDDVDSVVLPEAGSRSGGDCYTSLLLLLHPVHCRGTIVSLAYFMSFSRIEQDTLSCCCFSGVNMRHNTNVSGHFKRNLSWHNNLRIKVELKSRLSADYHLKCANALLASAILWVSSRFLNAEPVELTASIISFASLSFIVLSER